MTRRTGAEQSAAPSSWLGRGEPDMDVLSRNNVTVVGEGGPPVLFAHGFGCDQSMWRHVARPLSERGKVVLFDHVGAGASDLSTYDTSRHSTLNGYAEDLIEICEALGQGPVVFVGHSVSATSGVVAATLRPELFQQLALVCPSPRYIDAPGYAGGFAEDDILELLDLMDKNQVEWAQGVSPLVMGEGREEDEDEWRRSVCRLDPEIAKQFARVTFLSDNRDDYRRVRTPTLLIECQEDALAPPAVGEWVHAAISESRRIVLPTSGHCPHMSAPEAVIAALTPFLAETRAA